MQLQGGGQPQIANYWQPPLEITIRHPRDEDYFAHYREMFMDSVRRASRSDSPIGCEVSGGLDSSQFSAMAVRLQEAGQLQAPSVHGFTMAGEPGTISDEIAYARDVGRFLDAQIVEAQPFVPEFGWYADIATNQRDMPFFPEQRLHVLGKPSWCGKPHARRARR